MLTLLYDWHTYIDLSSMCVCVKVCVTFYSKLNFISAQCALTFPPCWITFESSSSTIWKGWKGWKGTTFSYCLAGLWIVD